MATINDIRIDVFNTPILFVYEDEYSRKRIMSTIVANTINDNKSEKDAEYLKFLLTVFNVSINIDNLYYNKVVYLNDENEINKASQTDYRNTIFVIDDIIGYIIDNDFIRNLGNDREKLGKDLALKVKLISAMRERIDFLVKTFVNPVTCKNFVCSITMKYQSDANYLRKFMCEDLPDEKVLRVMATNMIFMQLFSHGYYYQKGNTLYIKKHIPKYSELVFNPTDIEYTIGSLSSNEDYDK